MILITNYILNNEIRGRYYFTLYQDKGSKLYSHKSYKEPWGHLPVGTFYLIALWNRAYNILDCCQSHVLSFFSFFFLKLSLDCQKWHLSLEAAKALYFAVSEKVKILSLKSDIFLRIKKVIKLKYGKQKTDRMNKIWIDLI